MDTFLIEFVQNFVGRFPSVPWEWGSFILKSDTVYGSYGKKCVYFAGRGNSDKCFFFDFGRGNIERGRIWSVKDSEPARSQNGLILF